MAAPKVATAALRWIDGSLPTTPESRGARALPANMAMKRMVAFGAHRLAAGRSPDLPVPTK
jgi:hypothetical protein